MAKFFEDSVAALQLRYFVSAVLLTIIVISSDWTSDRMIAYEIGVLRTEFMDSNNELCGAINAMHVVTLGAKVLDCTTGKVVFQVALDEHITRYQRQKTDDQGNGL